ncbi:MAG: nitroreductase family protein, partial [Pseudomonadota bacterium]|nr:nitroreductase family protein [Pseudomonadota bacterium]
QRDHKIPTMEQRLSAGAFCQNLLVAAHASGFVAQWLTEWPAYDDEVKAALGHRPETDIVGFIYIGSAAEPPQERARADLDTVVSHWSGPAG